MKIRPLYDRIVVKRVEEKEQMQGGLYIPERGFPPGFLSVPFPPVAPMPREAKPKPKA